MHTAPKPPPELTAEGLAAMIRQHYPDEQQPEELALQLIAVAQQHGINGVGFVLWLSDHPRHELSSTHLVTWCSRYGLDQVTR